jgi:hypothetical protein
VNFTIGPVIVTWWKGAENVLLDFALRRPGRLYGGVRQLLTAAYDLGFLP